MYCYQSNSLILLHRLQNFIPYVEDISILHLERQVISWGNKRVSTHRQTPERSDKKNDSEHKCRLWKSETAKQRHTEYETTGAREKAGKNNIDFVAIMTNTEI